MKIKDPTIKIQYDLTGVIPLFNDFLVFTPLKPIKRLDPVIIHYTKRYHQLKHKYLKPEKRLLEKKYLSIKKRKKTNQNSYGGRVASLMQSYYLNHLRKVYIPGNTNWTKGYHKKIKYRRPLPSILIDTKESPRQSNTVGVITDTMLKPKSLE